MRMWLPLFFFSFLLTQGFSAPQFTKCSKTLRNLLTPKQDTSVELEIENTDPILSLLTTTDGTLAPLLPPKPGFSFFSFKLPPSFGSEFQGWSWERLAQEPWDNLNNHQKRLFLTWVTARKITPFFQDREVPGIRFKDRASLTFKKSTEFLGKQYEPGNHEIDISTLFRKVEYGTPNQNPNMLELHFRTHRPSGDVSSGARIFLEGIDVANTHQHVHVVTPLNIKRFQEQGQLRSVMFTDLYRRANLILEMMSIVEERFKGITVRRSGNVVFWDNLTPEKLNNVFDHLEKSRTLGRQPPLGTVAKMAFVGFRGADTYDDPSLVGFEIRGISQGSNPDYIRKYLNTLQWALTQDHFGVTPTEMKEWMDSQPKSEQLDMGSTWYNQPWEVLKTNGVGHRFEELIEPYFRKHFFNLEENRELKMLLHNWSNDPLLFNKPKLLKHIRRKQEEALERLNEGKTSHQRIVSDFLIQSGIYGIFTRSLGQ